MVRAVLTGPAEVKAERHRNMMAKKYGLAREVQRQVAQNEVNSKSDGSQGEVPSGEEAEHGVVQSDVPFRDVTNCKGSKSGVPRRGLPRKVKGPKERCSQVQCSECGNFVSKKYLPEHKRAKHGTCGAEKRGQRSGTLGPGMGPGPRAGPGCRGPGPGLGRTRGSRVRCCRYQAAHGAAAEAAGSSCEGCWCVCG